MSWLLSRAELTAEQLRAVELPPTEHRLILGGPGSGKTQVLLHRAAFLRDRGRVAANGYHLFVFTNTLKEYIESALSLLELPETNVSTFDSWCLKYHRTAIGPEPRRMVPAGRGRTRSEPDFPAIRRAVANLIRVNRPAPVYEFVLVDEGQDLDEEAFFILTSVSAHVTVCMDRKQQIYDDGADEQAILNMLGLRRRNLALLEALRCSPYIIATAAALVEDPEESRNLVAQVRTTAQMGRETPLLYFAEGAEDERERLIEIVQVRQRMGDRVAILLPLKRQVFGFAKGMADRGMEVETQNNVYFDSDAPKLLTYHSAKGLTFDTVLMPRLVPASFPSMDRSRIEHLLFVGVSRAVKWVYLSTDSRREFAPLQRLEALALEGKLTIQRSPAHGDTEDDEKPPEESGGDDVLDIL